MSLLHTRPILLPDPHPSPLLISFDPPAVHLTLLDIDGNEDIESLAPLQRPGTRIELDPYARAFIPSSTSASAVGPTGTHHNQSQGRSHNRVGRERSIPLTPDTSVYIPAHLEADDTSVFFRVNTPPSRTASVRTERRQPPTSERSIASDQEPLGFNRSSRPRLPSSSSGLNRSLTRSISPIYTPSPYLRRNYSLSPPACGRDGSQKRQSRSSDQELLIDYDQPPVSYTLPNTSLYISRNPSPNQISTSSTPDLTPGTSLSSAARHIYQDEEPVDFHSIILSKPSELTDLFKFDIQLFPYPTEGLASRAKPKPLPEDVQRILDLEHDQDSDYDNSGLEEINFDFQPAVTIDLGLDLDQDQDQEDFGTPDLLGEELDLDLLVEPDFDSAIDFRYDQDYKGYTCDTPPDAQGSPASYTSLDPAYWQLSSPREASPTRSLSGSSIIHSPSPRRIGDQGYDIMSLLNGTSSSSGFSTPLAQTPISAGTSIPAIHKISPYSLLLSLPSPRRTVPEHLVHPSVPDQLQSGIIESWIATEPSDESRKLKKRFLKDLTRTINARFGHKVLADGKPRYEVDVFGSVSWGGETGKSGDLDLVILDRALPQGYHPSLWRQPPGTPPVGPSGNGRRVPVQIAGLPRVYHTYALADCLRGANMFAVQPIPGASTPIVKFVHLSPPDELQCDINANDLGGWYNSSLILHYCLLSPHLLRPLIHVLKLWASSHNLNDASGSKGPATMSSYCLTLMAIAYLQHRGCLPNLQADINVPAISRPSDTSDPDVIWASWSKDQGVPAHVAFARKPSPGWTSAEPDLTVADALRGFFAFFSGSASPVGSGSRASPTEAERFNYKTQIVSVLHGGMAKRVKPVAGDKEEEDRLRAELNDQGYTLSQIGDFLNNYRKKRIAQEDQMGKGDRGIQPRNWSERRLVVQDPFLWAKNCAGMMSKQGLDNWLIAATKDHTMFEKKGKEATIDELLLNPNANSSGTPLSGRGRGRGSPVFRGFGGRGSPRGRGLAARFNIV